MNKYEVDEREARLLLEDLGRIAEPSFKEIETTKYIVKYLQKNNISVDKVFTTGCFGTINCGAEKTIALRADMVIRNCFFSNWPGRAKLRLPPLLQSQNLQLTVQIIGVKRKSAL